MPISGSAPDATFQTIFHQRWGHLNDPHVRALAWLLDAPDLLDAAAPHWNGKIASLPAGSAIEAADWLLALEQDPADFHSFLDLQPFSRLGRYAEKLMACYFQHCGNLFAHGVQVRAGNETIGEFDFLLRDGEELWHWEFATKFYLLEPAGSMSEADYFVGPNLADTLGAKMRKILERQLALASHPAAQVHLPLPVAQAKALIKGWLFYHEGDLPPHSVGVSSGHCRGFWCTPPELDAMPGDCFAILPRLSWLAPAKIDAGQVLDRTALQRKLAAHFEIESMPVMVAVLAPDGPCALETSRGFIVPDDWRRRADQRGLGAL